MVDTGEQLDILQKIQNGTRNISGQLGFAKMYQEIGWQTPGWQSLLSSLQNEQAATAQFDLTVDVPEEDVLIYADPMFEKVALNLLDIVARYGRVKHMLVSALEENGDLLLSSAISFP